MKKVLLSALFVLGFISISFSQVLIDINFDSYTIGNKIASVDTNFTTWGNAPGGSEDGTVVSTHANSGSNCIKIVTDNDLVLKLGDKTSGKYIFKYQVYTPNDSCSYFNLLHDFVNGTAKWSHEVTITKDSLLTLINANDTAYATVNPGTWHEIKYVIDVDWDFIVFYVDGVKVHEWPFSVDSGSPMNKLAAANYYGYDLYTDGTAALYVDDIYFEKIDNTGIDSPSETSDLSIYPNPASNDIQIIATAEMQTVKVYDIAGNLIISEQVNGLKHSVDVSSIASGVYFAQVNFGNKIITRKIVKK